ncbi:hypothetical protein F5Y17DRAFT_433636 [Xylariaceae sp. FL0594]|nr:hypothetical protein F5Y17DRAFT_433636 [Xylariaceae sp. FL0594]
MTLRIWARIIKRALGADDLVMLLTYALFLAESILITYVAQTGRTRHLLYLGGLSEIDSTLMWYIIILDVGIFVTGLGKVAVGITTLRIFGGTSLWHLWVVWIVLALTLSTCFLDFGISTFRCGDPRITWTLELQASAHCVVSREAQTKVNIFSNAVQVLADFAFSLLPMAVVWGFRMPQRKKIFLIVALGLTLFTGVAGTVKAVYAAIFNQFDLSFAIFPTLIWFGIEALLIIVCGSVPTLYPLYERYFKYRCGGYRPQVTGPTYVNSRSWGLSKRSGGGRSNKSSSRDAEVSLHTLHGPAGSHGPQQQTSFEVMKLDRYPTQEPGTACAMRRDANASDTDGIHITREFMVDSRTNLSRSYTDA